MRSSFGSGDDFDGLDDLMMAGGGGDPKAMAEWARKMQDKLGADLGPEFADVVGQLEHGGAPEDYGSDADGGYAGDEHGDVDDL